MRTRTDYKNWVGIIAIIGWLFLIGTLYLLSKSSVNKDPPITICVLENPSSTEFSEIALDNYLLEYKVSYPEIVKRQAILETGNFQSRIFTENNNLFGMKMPGRRKTTALYSKNGYAYYNHWIYSVIDYKLWQDYHNVNELTERQYLLLLGNIYAEDALYIIKIQSL